MVLRARIETGVLAVALGLGAGSGAGAGPGPTAPEPRLAAWQRHLELDRASPFRGLEARAIGPAFQGGRVEALALAPGPPETLYLGAGSGGLWRTRNGGTTWEPLFEHEASFGIGALAVDPADPRVLWVGTGEVLMARSSFAGTGVYRSSDGGRTWEHRGLTDTHHIAKIAIDPRAPDTVYVAAIGHLFSDGGQRGLFKTTDGGHSWTEVLEGDARTGVVDVLLDPRDPETLLAVTWERDRRPWNHVAAGPGSGVHRSADGGLTWSRVGGGLPAGDAVGRIGLARAPGRPEVLYALVDDHSPRPGEPEEAEEKEETDVPSPEQLGEMTVDALLAVEPERLEGALRAARVPRRHTAEAVLERVRRGALTPSALAAYLEQHAGERAPRRVGGTLYRSDDRGGTWRQVNEGPIGTAVGYDFCLVVVAPDDPDELYVLGNRLRRSRDGGRTFETVGGTIVHLRPNGSRVLHLDHHELLIDPQNADRLVLGTDGGLYVSEDRGASWLHVNNLPVGEFYAVDVDESDPYRILGGTQDTGALVGLAEPFRWDAPEPWWHVYLDPWGGGDSYFTPADPTDPAVVYFEHQFGRLRRRNLRTGATSDVMPVEEPGETPYRYNWMTPFLVSRHNPYTLYYGAQHVLKSIDRGAHWQVISPDLTTAPGPERRGNVPYGTLTSLAESVHRPGFLVAGSDDGRVHLTADDGRTWADVSHGLPGRWVSRVVASRHDPDRLYVTMTGYREDDFTAYAHRSDDRGASWRPIASGLPAEPVNVLVEDPREPDLLYLGTDLGLYVSLDGGGSWLSLHAGLPSSAVHDLAVQPREDELVVATHGRSLFVLDLRPVQTWARERPEELAVFEPRPVRLDRHPSDDEPSTQGCRAEARVHFHSPRAQTVTVVFRDEAGEERRSLEVEAVPGVNVARWDLREGDDDPDDVRGCRADAAPGLYRVELRAGDAQASTTLRVGPYDPDERPPLGWNGALATASPR